jgi:hypothetical protein
MSLPDTGSLKGDLAALIKSPDSGSTVIGGGTLRTWRRASPLVSNDILGQTFSYSGR